jgi:hypothetical protein
MYEGLYSSYLHHLKLSRYLTVSGWTAVHRRGTGVRRHRTGVRRRRTGVRRGTKNSKYLTSHIKNSTHLILFHFETIKKDGKTNLVKINLLFNVQPLKSPFIVYITAYLTA